MKFKSLIQLLDYFKDEKTGIKYYENIRWSGNPICPHCGADKPYVTNRGYKCSDSACYKKFTVKVGTIFENSKIPFRVWFAAIYLAGSHKKGISSVQLATDLGITQKTAWFVLHRVREMLKAQAPAMLGGPESVVEIDEAHVGGREVNRHTKKKQSDENPELANDGTPYNKKKIVVGIIERSGKVVLKYIPNATTDNIMPFIHQYVPEGATIYTDEATVYHGLKKVYDHDTVNHSMRIYVTGDVHTNTIENFWSNLKRGVYGIYHQMSDKHFERYLNEFAARFNARTTDPYQRIEDFLSKSEGGLLYKNLTAKN